MNPKNPKTDSGSYVGGIYTTRNGFSGSGLNCPKGTRLYNTETICPIFFNPPDLKPEEEFRMITKDAAPDILPYYAVSNYGRVMNVNSGKIMKPNYRPNGYEYLCLAADNCKNGQKKYMTHRLVLETFDPVENSSELQVNHIYGDKKENYYNIPDSNTGEYISSIEWSTPKENAQHRSNVLQNDARYKLTLEEVKKIRDLHDSGYSYEQINKNFFTWISCSTIQNVCLNKAYNDPNYTPKNYSNTLNPANVHKLTDTDADNIRALYNNGFSYDDIVTRFYPNFSRSAISDIVRGKTHNPNKN